jgi:hypothetical protein
LHQPTLIENEDRRAAGRPRRSPWDRSREPHRRRRAAGAPARAAEAADNAPPNPDFPGSRHRAEQARVEGYDAETARSAPRTRPRLAAAAIDASELELYGFVTSGVTGIAIASTTGLAVEQTMTDVAALALAAVDGASGYAERHGLAACRRRPRRRRRRGEREGGADARRGRARARFPTRPCSRRRPSPSCSPTSPTTPSARWGWSRSATTPSTSSGRRSSTSASRWRTTPLDARGLPKAFDFEGVPRQRVELVPGRRPHRRRLGSHERQAQAGAAETTGHAPPSSLRHWGPLPFALSVAGGEADSPEQLAEAVGDGIYVTRLHYLSIVDPREGIVTGMTATAPSASAAARSPTRS